MYNEFPCSVANEVSVMNMRPKAAMYNEFPCSVASAASVMNMPPEAAMYDKFPELISERGGRHGNVNLQHQEEA